jgi:c-di-GMP-binding flagellar brake protein YcgR
LNFHRPSTNRRNAFRLPTASGKNRVRATVGSASFEVIDLSATGAQMVWPEGEEHRLAEPHGPFELELPNGETVITRAKVVRRRSPAPGVLHVGAQWCLDGDARAKLTEFISCARLLEDSDLKVKNPLFIRNLLGPRSATGGPVMSLIQKKRRSQLQVETVTFEGNRRVVRGRLLDEHPPTLSADDSYAFILGGTAATVFESSGLHQDGRDVTFALPAEVGQKSERKARRIGLSGLTDVSLSFVIACEQADVRIAGAVVDVANGGLSFQFKHAAHGLAPGMAIGVLDVRLPGRRLSAEAVVRSIVDRSDGTSSCGVSLTSFHDPADAAAWRRFVFEHMHPNIVDGRGRAARSWAVLEASKYVDLWTAPETRAHIRNEYISSWNKTAGEVGHSLLIERQGMPVGLSAGSAAYPGSWILHHLARDGRGDGKGNDPLSENCELISGICRRLETETNFEHFLIYIERDKRFNERLYVDFFERYRPNDRPKKLMLTPMEVFRRSTDEVTGPPSTADVVSSTPELRALLLERLETLPELERKALGYDGDLDLRAFTQTCAERNYERSRDLYFALVDGQPAAALIAETGGEGVNIFGLLNTCRIVGLTAQKPSAGVREGLLRRAVEHYRVRGKKNFLFFDETDDTDTVPTQLGFQFVSAGLRWLAHRDVMPAWSAYLEGLLASPATTISTVAATVTELPRAAQAVVSDDSMKKAS